MEFEKDLVFIDQFQKELKQLVNRSCDKIKIEKKLNSLFNFLSITKNYLEHKNIEKLTNYGHLNSLKIKTNNSNIRLIFIDKDKNFIFITCFEEKNKKDYINAINISNERIKNL